jgi:hypothetical protein
MSARHARIELDRAPVTSSGRLVLSKLEKHLGKIDLQVGGTRTEQRCLAERCFGLLEPSGSAQDVAEIGMHLGTTRIEADGALTAHDRGREVPLIAQYEPQIAMSGGEIGSQGDGPAITGASIGQPPCRAQGIAEVGMGFGEMRSGGNRLADQLDRSTGIAARRRYDAEQMEGIRMTRRLPQKLPVLRLGTVEPAGPVMVEGGFQIGG